MGVQSERGREGVREREVGARKRERELGIGGWIERACGRSRWRDRGRERKK
jgi:hypothetical protein